MLPDTALERTAEDRGPRRRAQEMMGRPFDSVVRLNRRAMAIVAFAATLASIACGAGRKDDAVTAVEQFLRAVNSGDCLTAWSHYSSATQKNIRDEMRRALREADGPITPTTPETRYCQGTRRLVEATAVLRAPRAALQAVLADSSTWPQLLPEFSRLERLDAPSNDRQRLRLHFGEWQQPVVVEVRSYGNLVNARLPWTTLQWTTSERLLASDRIAAAVLELDAKARVQPMSH